MNILCELSKKYKVSATIDPIPVLISTLHQRLGNKRYLKDLEILLKRLELTSFDVETIWYLVRDLKHM